MDDVASSTEGFAIPSRKLSLRGVSSSKPTKFWRWLASLFLPDNATAATDLSFKFQVKLSTHSQPF